MKNIFRIVYYFVYRYFWKQRYRSIVIDKKVNFKNVSLKNFKHSFCGYYTNKPFDSTNNRILVSSTNSDAVRSTGTEKLILSILDLTTMKYNSFAETVSWNWQQGAMLQWLDKERVIYNMYSMKADDYYSEIYNLKTSKKSKISFPIYKVSSNGEFAISLNFKRLAKYRPDYGYFCHQECILDDENDGLFFVNLETGISSLLISLNELKLFKPETEMLDAKHKVNHIDISPDNKRFLFLHRWYVGSKKFTRLLSCNIDGSDLRFHKGNRFVSHNCWANNESIISFCKNRFGYKYILTKGLSDEYNLLLDDLKFDGHPIVNENQSLMLTDTANPDRSLFKSLYLFNLNTKELKPIAQFFMSRKFAFGEMRIDLHPKWGSGNSILSIDYNNEGKRSIGIIDLKYDTE